MLLIHPHWPGDGRFQRVRLFIRVAVLRNHRCPVIRAAVFAAMELMYSQSILWSTKAIQ
jgi:hypothetical protein